MSAPREAAGAHPPRRAPLAFTKYHGCGNDHIVFDQQLRGASLPASWDWGAVAARLCDRRFGVGADGIVVLEQRTPSARADCVDDSNAPVARVRFFNTDGFESEMCGNGLRIAAKHLFDETALSALQSRRSDWPALPRVFSVETLCGVKRVTLTEVDAAARFCHAVQVDMGSPVAMTELQTMRLDSGEASAALKYVAVNMGNPHCVIFVDGAGRDELRGGDRDTARGELDAQEEPLELRDFPVERIGSRVENLRSVFPNRTNVEFVVRVSKDVLAQRTFERSVGETLACGSGACATVVAAHSRGLVDARGGVWVRLRGGRLRIEWAGAASDHVFMTGAATRVFTGEVEPELLLASR